MRRARHQSPYPFVVVLEGIASFPQPHVQSRSHCTCLFQSGYSWGHSIPNLRELPKIKPWMCTEDPTSCLKSTVTTKTRSLFRGTQKAPTGLERVSCINLLSLRGAQIFPGWSCAICTHKAEDEGTFVLQGVCTMAGQGTCTRVPFKNYVKIRTASAEHPSPSRFKKPSDW